MHELAGTFGEHIQITSTEDPHAVILGWWRKLSLALDDYFSVLGKPRGKASEVERLIATDPRLGPAVATKLRDLRERRNEVAHS